MRKLELVSVAMFVWLLQFATFNKVEGVSQAKPGCVDKCGNVIIRYPFGIGKNCSLNESFEVICTNGVPTLANSDSYKMFNISEINFPNQVVLESDKIMAVDCGSSTSSTNVSFEFAKPFMVSSVANRFRAMGCEKAAYIENIGEGFRSLCYTQCGGQGQCQIAVPEGLRGYNYNASTDLFPPENCKRRCSRNCSFAVLVKEDFKFNKSMFDSYLIKKPEVVNTAIRYPLVVEWEIQNSSCGPNNTSDICGENAWCNYTESKSGFHCSCKQNCTGNPYLNGAGGCQTRGPPGPVPPSPSPSSPPEGPGSPIWLSPSPPPSSPQEGPGSPIWFAAGVLSTAMVGASLYSYGSWSKMKATTKLTSNLLHDLQNIGDVSSPDIPVFPDGDGGPDTSPDDKKTEDRGPSRNPDDPNTEDGGPNRNPDDPNTKDGGPNRNPDDPNTEDGGPNRNPDDPNEAYKKQRDFNKHDLKKAIKVYQKAYQKGQRIAIWASRRRVATANLEGYGVVEIRKYTVQERSHIPLFVKGVRTLSGTLTHANVAKLLGISTRESSLIYEHFSDRTLHDSLHCSPSDRPSWEERLKIAAGTAKGLAFTHSKGLYHGNVKSSNILIYEECNCKLVEFGVARVWRKNTLLKSSRGYVDQEYMNLGTNQLIASMDVYSFGVVLVELITGQDPSSKAFNRRGRRSLAMDFISAVDEGRLEEVVDHSIWVEDMKDQLEGVADLAKKCLQQRRKERPKMQEVSDSLLNGAPNGPRPQGGRPTNATDNQPGVAQNPESQGQAQSALDVCLNDVKEELVELMHCSCIC